MYRGKSFGEAVVALIGAFVFAVMILIAMIVVNLNGGTSRTTITGEVVKIEQTTSIQGEVILIVADPKYSVAADGSERVYTYNRPVYFKNADDVANIVVGDIVTVSGKLNGYSLFDAKIES